MAVAERHVGDVGLSSRLHQIPLWDLIAARNSAANRSGVFDATST